MQPIDTSQKYEIGAFRFKSFIVSLITTAVAIIPILLLIYVEPKREYPEIIRYLFLSMILIPSLLFVIMALVSFWNLALFSPIVIFSKEGIYDKRLSTSVIPWSEVQGIFPFKLEGFLGTFSITIYLKRSFVRSIPLKPQALFQILLSFIPLVKDKVIELSIGSGGLNVSSDEFRSITKQYFDTYYEPGKKKENV
ncbi:MAG: hypothetical protein ACRBBN_13465 [Methyloligellaceae bacterium]